MHNYILVNSTYIKDNHTYILHLYNTTTGKVVVVQAPITKRIDLTENAIQPEQ